MTMTAEQIELEHQKDLVRLRNFRLLDDDFMRKVFDGDPLYIQIVLRIVLNMPDLVVIHVQTEMFVENLLKRSIRLDVLATDASGRKFNIEIQRSDEGADSRRARYNSSMLDANVVKKGTKFYDLPETWVIFITENDIFEQGWDVYKVERIIEGMGKKFDDGAHIVYVNGQYRGNDEIGKLMHDFSCTNPDDMYNKTLAERARFFKESKEGVEIMCKAMEDMRDEYLQIGIQQGIQQDKNSVALRMIRSGKYSDDEIAEMSGLSIMDVKKLRAEAAA